MLDVLVAAPLGLAQVLTASGILYLFIGVVLGLIVGVLPGIGGPTAIALLIPVSYNMTPYEGMTLMAAAMGAVTFGGAITAILVNVPGSPVNIATSFDGYPLAQKGKAGTALGISATASALGGIFGILVLIFAIPVLGALLKRFGPPEYFLMILFGLISIPMFTKGNLIKGIFAGILGISLAFIGFDATSGAKRYTFGSLYLYDGIDLVSMILGVFAISEAFTLARAGKAVAPVESKQNLRDIMEGVKSILKYKKTFFRSSVIGTVIGIIPGMGGVIANTFSYIVAAQLSPNRDKFGTGEIEGIVASETANNAKDGGSLLPTLAFGIPGSAETAVLLGALILHGIAPGPGALKEQLDITWTIIWALLLSTIVASVIGILAAPHLAKVTKLPGNVVAAVIVCIGLLGAFTSRESVFDVFVAMCFGFIGYFMKQHGFPLITLVLGFILGGIAEYSLRQTLMMSDNGVLIFLSRPFSLAILIILLLSIFFTQMYPSIKKRKALAAERG